VPKLSTVTRCVQIQVLFLLIFGACRLNAQQPATVAKAQRDELIFTDGERLLGHIERSNGSSVIFKSDMAGEVTVDWGNVKELHSSLPVAIVPKGVKFGRRRNTDQIPQGEISVSDQKIQVANDGSAAPQTIPVSSAAFVIDKATFEKSLRRPSLFDAWKGSATAGVSLVLATQDNRSYTSAITLTRAIPTEPWMNPENRTSIEFSSSFGELTQPGQPRTKTSIFHADAERDEYFTPDFYTFAEAAFDHNFSQGLNLQQTFGGGLGWTLVKEANSQLDLKAELTYVNQQFALGTQNQKFLGSVFSEGYERKFRHGMTLHESLSASPAWSSNRAYSANANVIFSIPITKRFSVALDTLDTFLNDPSPGFKKNSFQYSTGLTYTLP
jgi:hypothetical protein